MNDKQIAALARRNAAKAKAAENGAGGRGNKYDATLPAEPQGGDRQASSESQRLFKEMKRREF
ncbi:MAG TPA: hypothetical protein VEZ47_07825 [Gemmatirosa sp.]|jgi:hypothetical protein|nr:hypothetical protein [Gemmatirosa sp.]